MSGMQRFQYRGFHGAASVCGLAIEKQSDDSHFVVLSELPDNPGTGVSQRCDFIATQVWRSKLTQTALADIRWFEHHAARGNRDETFDEIAFRVLPDGLRSPNWTPVIDAALLKTLREMVGSADGNVARLPQAVAQR